MAKALITGASSGIGEAFARHLANMGYDLIVVARREERLQALADKVTVDVEIVVADLTKRDDITRVESLIASHDDIAYLVNNAGFSGVGLFADQSIDFYDDMIQLHVMTSTRLAHAVIPQMKANKNGAIINVSSFGGFVPMPTSATYNATKAYLTSFSESLSMELAPHGIVVQALCPGFTYTEIWDTAGFENTPDVPQIAWMSSDEVVIESLRAIPAKKYRVTPRLLYQIMWRLFQLAPLRYLLKRYMLQVNTP
ncbi:MAG: SDR family oxidoreductase [Chloroflexota bacterium]